MKKLKQLKIGNLKLKNPLILAPMVDVTSLPYRLLCKKAGAGLTLTEMIYADAITHENKKTKDMMKTIPEENPIGIQITGNNLNEIKKTLPHLKKYSLIDLNCGCPSIRITGNEAGSFLLKNPDKIAKIIKILKLSRKPVTAKIRLGYDSNNVLKIAKAIEKAGADAIIVHARLAVQSNKTPADWNQIRLVKENVKIPVIGNGDIIDGPSAKKMLEIADGVMIGRAAIGDPLIFKRILYYLKTGKEKKFSVKDNLNQFKQYLKLCKKYDLIDMPRIKYLGSRFLRNFEGASKLRANFMSYQTFDECLNLLEILKI